MNNINNKIENLYNKSSFGDQYGLDIWISILIILVFFIATLYFYILNHIKIIKAKWPKNRCNPAYIPFAGIIENDKDQSAFDATSQNFNYCTQNILSEVAGYLFLPLEYLTDITEDSISLLGKGLDDLRGLFDNERDFLEYIMKDIYNRIQNALAPFYKYIRNAKTIYSKSLAVLTTGLYTLMASLIETSSLFRFIYDKLKIILIVIAGIIATLTAAIPLIFFDPPLIVADTVLLVTNVGLLTFGTVMATFMSGLVDALPAVSASQPEACFSADAIVHMGNNEMKPIINVCIGDKLTDGGIVTGIMKMSSKNQDICNIDGTLVTSLHRLFHPELGLIHAKNHPNAIEIKDFRESYVYCLNSTSKRLVIGGNIYVDWDDLDAIDMLDIQIHSTKNNLIPKGFLTDDIHTYLECGFTENMTVELDDGRTVSIKDLAVNDVLRFGEKVLGVIKIDGKTVNSVKEYYFSAGKTLECTGNILINDSDLGDFPIYTLIGKEVSSPEYLYQIITDTGGFIINGIHVGDYNSGLEQLLKPQYFLSY